MWRQEHDQLVSNVDCAWPCCVTVGMAWHLQSSVSTQSKIFSYIQSCGEGNSQYTHHLWPRLAQVGMWQVETVSFGHWKLPGFSQAST